MKDRCTEFISAILAMLPTIGITLLGNCVRFTRFHRQEEFSWAEFLVGMLSAAFMGIMIHAFCRAIGANPYMQVAVAGMCGYAGSSVLDLMASEAVELLRRFIGGDER